MASSTINDVAGSAQEQVRELRDQVDSLMRDRVSPLVAEAATRAQEAARQAQDMAEEKVEALSGRVREMPITAILIAGAVGFILGRIAR